jgi:hypothetical protein
MFSAMQRSLKEKNWRSSMRICKDWLTGINWRIMKQILILLVLTFSFSGAFCQKLSERILLERVDLDTIKTYHIKSVTYKNSWGNFTEQFDTLGSIIYERYDSWDCCTLITHSYGERLELLSSSHVFQTDTFQTDNYYYSENGLLETIAITRRDGIIYDEDDIFKDTTYTNKIHLSYDSEVLIRYEGLGDIEIYKYDDKGNLSEITIDLQPGVLACANRTSKWTGKYNEYNQLIEEVKYGFPDKITYLYTYSKNGKIEKAERISEGFGAVKEILEYYYGANGLLERVETFNLKRELLSTEHLVYEKY